MGSGRRIGVVLGAALAPLFVASAPSFARAQPASAASRSAVSPFFLVVVFRRHHPRTLIAIRVGGVTRDEHTTSACSACGTTKFAKTVGSHRVLLSASPLLRMRSSTRVIVGVTADGADGRWIRIRFQRQHYESLDHGCMPPSVKSLTPADAAHSSIIPKAPCGLPPATEYVYWRGTDHQLYEQQYISPKWKSPRPIGSGHAVASAPTAVVLSNGDRDVFWTGTDGWLYEMSYAASTASWSNPERLPGRGKLTSPPSAVVDAHGVVHVFFRATDRFLWEMAYRGGVWALPGPLNSGPVESAPAPVALPDGSLELFWWGGGLYEMHPPQLAHKLPGAGTLGSAPTAILDSRHIVHVFWQGTNRWLWELSNPDSGSDSVPLNSGPLGSAPSAVIFPDNGQDVFWRSTDGGLREMRWYSKKWHLSSPVPNAHRLDSAPAAVMAR
jgi:hypothetical protein